MTALALRTARVEARIGRRLTAAETHVDIEQIDQILNDAKDDLDAAIQAEQARLARQLAVEGRGAMQVTADMLKILARLRTDGQQHARAELRSMGYSGRRFRAFTTDDELEQRLRARLRSLTIKINNDALGGDISTVAITAIERAVTKVLGGRSIAADLVSPAFMAGLSDTFEQHTDLVSAWQYSAVLDGGLCEECAPHDGEIYGTLDELFQVLPNFGPNPDCLGGDRCRCRAVPVPPDEALARDTVPPNDNIDWSPSRSLAIQESRDAVQALEHVHDIPADTAAVTIALSDELSVTNPGRYTPGRLGGPKIELARDAVDPGFTTLHEYGHYLSDQAIGEPGIAASFNHTDLDEWRQAIVESDAVRRFVALGQGHARLTATIEGDLVEIPVDPDIVFGYYLHPEELFARSYSQWAAIRSGDAQLQRELAEARLSPYPEQWHDDDFAAIAAAFDRLIERLGWRTGRH